MELKLSQVARELPSLTLLIVPYGIETCTTGIQGIHCRDLLIVPYGIETRN